MPTARDFVLDLLKSRSGIMPYDEAVRQIVKNANLGFGVAPEHLIWVLRHEKLIRFFYNPKMTGGAPPLDPDYIVLVKDGENARLAPPNVETWQINGRNTCRAGDAEDMCLSCRKAGSGCPFRGLKEIAVLGGAEVEIKGCPHWECYEYILV